MEFGDGTLGRQENVSLQISFLESISATYWQDAALSMEPVTILADEVPQYALIL